MNSIDSRTLWLIIGFVLGVFFSNAVKRIVKRSLSDSHVIEVEQWREQKRASAS